MASRANCRRWLSAAPSAVLCVLVVAELTLVGAPVAGAAGTAQTVTGRIASIGAFGFTLRTPGRATGVLNALTRAATRIEHQDWPYVWGGGHAEAGVASIGIRGGPGYNGKRRGYDCSGSVAAVLAGGGLWPTGASVPGDAGVIQELRAAGLIKPHAARGIHGVTLYDWPGRHIFMNIDGRFWGTSDGAGGGDRKGGPGWLQDGAYDASRHQFRRYHFTAAALRAKTTAGYTLGFDYPRYGGQVLGGYGIGALVKVTYKRSRQGTMVVSAVTYGATYAVSGVVDSFTDAGPVDDPGPLSSFTMTDRAGHKVAFKVGAGTYPALVDGDAVKVTYYRGPAYQGPRPWVLLTLQVTDAVGGSGGVGVG